MKSRRNRHAAVAGSLMLGLLACTAATAGGTAVRGPNNPQGENVAESIDDGQVVDLNPAREVVTTDTGFDSITNIRVDTAIGVMGGFASFDLDHDTTFPFPFNGAVGSSATGILTLNTFIVGPPTPSAPDVVDVTVEIEFDGAFSVTRGTPTLLLAADLIGTRFNPAAPLDGAVYQSTLSFLSSAESGGAVTTLFESRESPFLGDDSDYAGGSHEVISDAADNLHGLLRLTFAAAVDDTLVLQAFISGIAGPEPDPADAAIEDGAQVLASAGAVEFSHTARLRLLLPEGYSLGGSDPLASIVEPAPVPLPAAAWLFAPAAMLALRRRSAGATRSGN
ncbi:MAG: hypothetical protein AB7Q97_25395 [Gammaproteobacteria bacterium]